jgi:hypothetical protein
LNVAAGAPDLRSARVCGHQVFERDRVGRRVHRMLPLATAAAMGVVAGTLLGDYWVHGGPLTLSAALVGMVLTAAAPVVLWRREEHGDRRRADEAAQRDRRARYDAHAERLSEQAIRPLRTLRLAWAEPYRTAGASPGSGLAVNEGDQVRPLEELPNWPYALEHLRADPALGPAWSAAERVVRDYCARREGIAEDLAGRYTHVLLSRYGFETRLEGSRFDPAPWYDVRALVGLALALHGPLDRSTVTVVPAMIGDAVDTDAAAAHLVLIGETPVACVPCREAANPAEVADLFELGRSGAAAATALRSLTQTEARARSAIQRLAEESRRYADRMLIERAGSGTCAVCRPWLAPAPVEGRSLSAVVIERA